MNSLYACNSSSRRFSTVINMCWRLLLFISLLLSCLFLFPEASVAQTQDSEKEQLPFNIEVTLTIIDIAKIDGPSETFDVDSYLHLKWNDPELYKIIADDQTSPQDSYTFYSTSEVQATLEELNWPGIIQFTNQVGKREILSSYLMIESSGNITYYERFQGTFHTRFELYKYPFDAQDLQILVEAAYFDTTKQEFDPNSELRFQNRSKNNTGNGAYYTYKSTFELEEWFLKSGEPVFAKYKFDEENDLEYSIVTFNIKADRKYGFQIWKIFFPLLLIICISWSVFWIGRESVSSRLSVASIGFLTAIAFGFFVSNSLPKISYLTFMDLFIIGIYIFMTLTVFAILSTYLLEMRGKEALAVRLNYHARWCFPVLLILYLLVVALRFW